MHLHSQAKCRRVWVAVATTIKEDNTTDRNTVLLQGVCDVMHTYLLTYLLTYSMEQSPSWEANWFCS
jgi:hypothetical protein